MNDDDLNNQLGGLLFEFERYLRSGDPNLYSERLAGFRVHFLARLREVFPVQSLDNLPLDHMRLLLYGTTPDGSELLFGTCVAVRVGVVYFVPHENDEGCYGFLVRQDSHRFRVRKVLAGTIPNYRLFADTNGSGGVVAELYMGQLEDVFLPISSGRWTEMVGWLDRWLPPASTESQ